MGESDRYQDFSRPRRRLTLGDDNNALVGLITINIIFFIVLLVVEVIYANVQGSATVFAGDVLPYFQVPAKPAILATRPWTLLTSMFTHYRFFEMLGGMMWLWAFGYIFQELTGNRKLIPVYIYGGIAGAVVFIIAVNSFPSMRPNAAAMFLMGGSASNMAIAAAATVLAPDYRFFRNIGGGIPIWVLTLVYVLIDFAGVASAGAAYSLAHLAGAGAGFLFVFFIRKGYDGSVWMNNFYHGLMNLFTPGKKSPAKSIKEKVFYNTGQRKPYNKTSNVTQQRVDEILDKINQKGYHFLTDEEKNILKRAADEDLN